MTPAIDILELANQRADSAQTVWLNAAASQASPSSMQRMEDAYAAWEAATSDRSAAYKVALSLTRPWQHQQTDVSTNAV